LRLWRKIVGARIAPHDEHGMRAADAAIGGVIESGISHAAALQFLHALRGFSSQAFNFAEFDRFRGARLGARRNQSGLLAVIAEGTFEGLRRKATERMQELQR